MTAMTACSCGPDTPRPHTADAACEHDVPRPASTPYYEPDPDRPLPTAHLPGGHL